MNALIEKLNEHMRTAGAALWGIADLSALPSQQNGGYPRAIAFALAVNPVVAKRILGGPSVHYSHEYNTLNMRLDALSRQTARILREHGFDAQTITREDAPYSEEEYQTRLPYKTVARLAGLGWIGRSALLLTPEYGSAVRLGATLTNAPLPANVPLAKGCGGCTICRDICPGGAIHGVDWSEGLSRDALVDPRKCSAATRARGQDLPVRSVTCGLCIAACPYTRRFLKAR